MNFPSKVLEKAVEEISSLSELVKKSALRLALHLLHVPESQGMALGKSHPKIGKWTLNIVRNVIIFQMKIFYEICSNHKRNDEVLCIVEDVRDVMAIENTAKFNGKYLVLGGKISPMEGINHQLNISSIERKLNEGKVKELIFALSATGRRYHSVLFIQKFKDFR